jgi:dienelactone hydrolase
MTGTAGDVSLSAASPRGARLEVMVNLPDGQGPFPALVLAPGNRYHMRQPILAESARAAAAAGVAMFRFDWAHRMQGHAGTASQDLDGEAQDMAAVLALATGHAQVDRGLVFVGGKSVRSVVAWRLFAQRPALRGAVLLTPLVSAADGARHYPGLQRERRPVLMVAGDADPLCDLETVRRLRAGAARPVTLEVVAGNHELMEPGRSPGSAGTSSAPLTAAAVVRFIAAASPVGD